MSRQVAGELLKWERRSIVLSAFGLVGFGAVVGAGTIYWFFVRRKVEAIFQIQSVIIHELQKDVDNLKQSVASIKDSPSVSGTRFREGAQEGPTEGQGGKSSDDEEAFMTASDLSDAENDEAGAKLKKRRRSSNKSVKLSGDEEDDEDPIVSFLEGIDKLLEGSIADQHEAFNTLKINKDKLQSSCDFWWRLAKATHSEAQIAASNGDKELRRAHVESAFTCAEKALKLDDTSSDAHKWYAITIGTRSEFFSLNERIQSGFTFKQHVDKAVALNPKDAACYHLLGRFCLEVSQLSWFERKVAATLFSNPPTATAKEALENFLEAEKIKPFKENRLFIAKCYISAGELKKAAKWLEAASQMPIHSSGDKAAQQEITPLFAKYRKHLNS